MHIWPSYQSTRVRFRLWSALFVIVLAVGVSGPDESTNVHAEGFADAAFERQWRSTDAEVASGAVKRTFFWGPEAFAHTTEVYAESPDNGRRQVQYFDKARMELSKRPGQDPGLVTNGLLTVELVSGRLQVGDTQFLQRAPATNPVAGDPLNNTLAPTYATFNQGRLAFGVSGALTAADRTGQPVTDAVNVM